jgi:hypothetical protein
MGKRARKVAQDTTATGDFTDQLRQRSDFADARTELRPGETRRVALTTRRRQSRVVRWRADGWVDERGAASILRFELLQDACGYDRVRSCCDNSVRGGGDGMPPMVVRARQARSQAANAVRDQVALMAVVEMLADEGKPEAIRRRLFGGAADSATVAARWAVRSVAADLAGYFGA